LTRVQQSRIGVMSPAVGRTYPPFGAAGGSLEITR
jgi:hypothetical protein